MSFRDLASEADICLFQEDIIPLYKPPSISSGLFGPPAFASFNCPYIERGAITRFVHETFPVRAKVVISALSICVELLFKVASFVFSLCGDTLLNWYFKFPPFGFALIFFFPYIFVLAYYFIGIKLSRPHCSASRPTLLALILDMVGYSRVAAVIGMVAIFFSFMYTCLLTFLHVGCLR